MAALDSNDLVELTSLVRGFAGQVQRSLRLGQRLPRPSRRARPVSLLFIGVDVATTDGRANELLDNMIAAMGWPRDQVGVCASADDVAHAGSAPMIIIGLGGEATRQLLGPAVAFSDVRGKWQRWRDLDVMPTFHPSELLEKNELKRVAWQDLQAVMAKCAALGIVPQATP